MNKAKIEKFKKLFQKELEEINNSKREVDVDISGDEVDRAQADTESTIIETLSGRLLIKARKIEKALIKIEDGSFGECEQCGEQIGEKRLIAKPDAETCIDCAERIEHLSKQYAT